MIYACEQDPLKRADFACLQAELPLEELVIIDETGSRIGMTPRYARAPRGQRVTDYAPRNYGHTLSLIGALSLSGLQASLVVEGAIDSLTFEAYLSQCLLPTLRPGQIIVMDHLSVHTTCAVRDLIEAHGCQLLFLPPYSPDFSPIEGLFSKLKTHLRRLKADSYDTLIEAIASALETISPSDILGWFSHCGYPIPDQST